MKYMSCVVGLFGIVLIVGSLRAMENQDEIVYPSEVIKERLHKLERILGRRHLTRLLEQRVLRQLRILSGVVIENARMLVKRDPRFVNDAGKELNELMRLTGRIQNILDHPNEYLHQLSPSPVRRALFSTRAQRAWQQRQRRSLTPLHEEATDELGDAPPFVSPFVFISR